MNAGRCSGFRSGLSTALLLVLSPVNVAYPQEVGAPTQAQAEQRFFRSKGEVVPEQYFVVTHRAAGTPRA